MTHAAEMCVHKWGALYANFHRNKIEKKWKTYFKEPTQCLERMDFYGLNAKREVGSTSNSLLNKFAHGNLWRYTIGELVKWSVMRHFFQWDPQVCEVYLQRQSDYALVGFQLSPHKDVK